MPPRNRGRRRPAASLVAAAVQVIGAAGDGDTADALLAQADAALAAAPGAATPDALALLDAYASRLYQCGQLDEALRIRTEEQLPVYERLGDVRSLLVCRAKIALTLLARGRADERAQANTLLCLALAAARHLRLSEAGEIEQILQQAGMDCDGAI